jgi:hypothetical protein
MNFKVIKKGDRSNLVGEWQTFLRGEKIYLGQIDNHFGNLTETATIKFQEKNKLKADGVVGENTYKKAIQKGFHSNEIIVSVTSNDNVPPKPNFSPITGNSNRERLFGKIEFVARPTKTNPEGILITNDFESKNIVRVELPALSKATNGSFTAMRWHKECEYQLVKMFERFEKEKLHTHILSYAGAFYPRFIRGSRTQLSNHSWGTAFDINVAQNGLGKVPAMIGQKGCVRDLVPIANECGFYWGGHFTRKDGMHFEIAKIINSNL